MKTEMTFYLPFLDLDEAARQIYRCFHINYKRERWHSGIGDVSAVELKGRYIRLIRQYS